MAILLDTHILIWIIEENPQLNSRLLARLGDPDEVKYLSQISLMELAIKMKLGKLPDFQTDINGVLSELSYNNVQVLALKNNHIDTYLRLPLFENHRNPFDRFILATALCEGFSVMSKDDKFLQYAGLVNIIS